MTAKYSDVVKKFTEHRAVLRDFRDEIAAFNTECESREHTDIGDAWDLINGIHRRCVEELKPPKEQPKPATLEIQRVICLSTGHAENKDINELLHKEDRFNDIWQPIFTAEHTYGAFVYIPQDCEDDAEQHYKDVAAFGYSESFIKLIKFGAKHKARYLHLDSDGPVLAWAVEAGDLDIHEW